MLLYFILGILFISLGIPILDALSSVISAWSQYVVYTFAFKIFNIKQKMGLDQDEEQEETKILGFTSAIGDQIPCQDFDQDQEQEE